jgi:hypothetical protein
MMAVELATYLVSKDVTSPARVEAYMVDFVAFYVQGFGVPSHRFLYSQL